MLNKNIHLNSVLYEFYPFSYFIFGTSFYLLFIGLETLRVILFLACFGAGFIALLVRSKHRRIYKQEKTRVTKKFWMAKPIYEYIPAAYITIGFLLITKTEHLIVFVGALGLFTVGIYIIVARVMHRFVLRTT